MKKPKHVVLIIWEDSCSVSGWKFPDAAREWHNTAPMTIQTVGFVYRKDKSGVTVHQSYDDQRDPNISGMFHIPRGCIKSMKVIAVRKK